MKNWTLPVGVPMPGETAATTLGCDFSIGR
jgi:hypothetical protein